MIILSEYLLLGITHHLIYLAITVTLCNTALVFLALLYHAISSCDRLVSEFFNFYKVY